MRLMEDPLLWAAAEAISLPCSRTTRANGASPWDGTALHGATNIYFAENACWWHEIGHALLAPDEGMSLPGWGQGVAFDGMDGGPVLPECGTEEEASALGVWAHLVLGAGQLGVKFHADKAGVKLHAYEHGWVLPHKATAFLQRLEEPYRARVEARLIAGGLPTPWVNPQ